MAQLWLSIIIPVYGVEKYIEECLDSIVIDNANAVAGIEVIVVDDGSKDRSGEIADRYASQYAWIRVIHKENAGVAAARNTGISQAKGKWLYFMDSDDWMAKGVLGEIKQVALKAEECDLLLFDAWKNIGEKETRWEHFDKEQTWDEKEHLQMLQRGMLYFPSMNTNIPLAAPWDKLYQRAFLLENKLFFAEKLNVLDDMIFNMEVLGGVKKVSYHKTPIYHYRHVSDSITNQYKPDRVSQDMQVWEYIQQYMQKQTWEKEIIEQFRQVFYCRIVKSFSICCRLCFFHKNNKKSLVEQLAYVKKVQNMEPYKTAFRTVQMRNAEWKLKPMILFGKCNCTFGVWLLHLGQTVLGRLS